MKEDDFNTELRMVLWQVNGYPPIDLNKEVPAITHLITEYRKLKQDILQRDSQIKDLEQLLRDAYSKIPQH